MCDREVQLAKRRAYHASRREVDNEACRRYYAENAKELRAKKLEYKKDPRVRRRISDWGLKHHYGISRDDYDRMLIAQSGCCACCDRPFSSNPREPAVDHNHLTGAIRGLLCLSCNLVVGHLGDDPIRAVFVVRYLLKHAGVKQVMEYCRLTKEDINAVMAPVTALYMKECEKKLADYYDSEPVEPAQSGAASDTE